MNARLPMPRRVRIAIVGASPCGACTSACCRRTVSEYAVLLQTDEERRRFAAWSVTLPVRDLEGSLTHERVITYRDDGNCPFLGDDGLCTIYDDRPLACRQFECTRHYGQQGHAQHGLFLQGNPRVVKLLETVSCSQ